MEYDPVKGNQNQRCAAANAATERVFTAAAG